MRLISWYLLFLDVLVILLLPQGSDGRYVKNDESRIRDYLLSHENFTSTDRPVLDSAHTVDVTMTMQIYAMLDLNERDQVITTASWITLQWRDERLTWNASEFGGVDIVNMFNNEIWTPKIFLSNALDYDALMIVSPDRGSIVLSSDGVASLGTPLVLSTQCPLYIRYFPFDTQACMFRFFPENCKDEQMRLFSQEAPDESAIGSREWKMVALKNARHTVLYRNFAPSVPEANISLGLFCLFLERNPSHYIQTLMIPSTVLCLMTFATFLAPPDSGERISLGVSMILGLTVFQLLISDLLPAASEEPAILSYYLTVNFILACVAVPFSLININIAYGDSRIIVLRYRRSRKVFLEYLPRALAVPSYTQRIRLVKEDAKRSHHKQLEDDLSEVNDNDADATRMGNGNIINDNSDVENSRNGQKPAEGNFKKDDGADTSNDDQPNEVEGALSVAEKTKIELRTVALVMDRLVVVAFLIMFLAYFILTMIRFQQNPGVTDDIRAICGSG